MADANLKILGNNVRVLRHQKGLSQEQLAELTGLHRTYIGGIERGERNVSILNLIRLSKALDITASKMVEGIK
jgi:transcriptional regulator with XRE-family HTH domain